MLVRLFRCNVHAACMANRNGTVGFRWLAHEGWLTPAALSEGLDLPATAICPDTAFTHEIGQCRGMNHDRGSSAVEALNATVPPVSYGCRLRLWLQRARLHPVLALDRGGTCQMP